MKTGQIEYGEYIELCKRSNNPKKFWCYHSNPSILNKESIPNAIKIKTDVSFSSFKEKVLETSSSFIGKFYLGVISVYFEKEEDFNFFLIKYPDYID